MLSQEQWQDVVDMGIIICEKTGRALGVDANIFASYVATRYPLIYNKENFYNYKDEEGKWVKIEDMKMKTTLRQILHKYYQSLWNRRLEDEYIEALKRIVFFEGDLNSER
ncbi:hypothetical protein, partial [Clostridium perfringens]